MSTGTIRANGFFPAEEGVIINNGPVKISVTSSFTGGTFGAGTASYEHNVDGEWTPLLNEQVAVAFTADDDSAWMLNNGDKFRINFTGGTNPIVKFKIGTKQ